MRHDEYEWAMDIMFSQSLMFGRAQELPLEDFGEWRAEVIPFPHLDEEAAA